MSTVASTPRRWRRPTGAVDLAESAGDATAMTWAYCFRVDNARFEDAQSHLPAALALAHHTGAEWRAPRLLQRLAFTAIAEARYADARLLHAEALPLARLTQDDQCVAAIDGDEALACLLSGDADGAALYGRSEALVDARSRYRSEQRVFRQVTDGHLERLRSAQPLRWSLGME